jgi:AAA+ ATPase superfamily predicted ATPase
MEKIIKREQIIRESGVREIFTPFSPIQNSECLSGREDEISSVYSSLNTPGQHSLVYGERGVGKSSLANVISQLAKDTLKYNIYFKKCASDDSFLSIVSDMLSFKGYDTNCTESIKEIAGSGGANIGLNLFGANLNSTRKSQNKLNLEKELSSPSWVASLLKDERFLLIIDEIDLIKEKAELEKVAILLKHLSDYDSQLKILIVGVSSIGRDLVINHKSVERCINEIYLKPIKISALKNIVQTGEDKIGIKFDDLVIDDIVEISGGYPHFVHLIALKCAEEAIINNRIRITIAELSDGLKNASKFSEGQFIRVYEGAIKHNTEVSRKVLLAAALCHPKGFLVSEIVEMLNEVIDPELPKRAITNCLSKWVTEDESNILTRVSRGQYKFCDPRLMSYIKMTSGFTYDERSLVADILKNNYSLRFVE